MHVLKPFVAFANLLVVTVSVRIFGFAFNTVTRVLAALVVVGVNGSPDNVLDGSVHCRGHAGLGDAKVEGILGQDPVLGHGFVRPAQQREAGGIGELADPFGPLQTDIISPGWVE